MRDHNTDLRNGHFEHERYELWCEQQARAAGKLWPAPASERPQRSVYKAFKPVTYR